MTAQLDNRGAPPDERRPSGSSSRKQAWRSRWYRFDVKGSPYLYVLPFFGLFAVFGLFPLIYTAVISTTAWSPRKPGSEDVSVGLDNYTRLLSDDNFQSSQRTLLLAFDWQPPR